MPPTPSSLPEAGSDEAIRRIHEAYQLDPVFHAKTHLAWNYSCRPEWFWDGITDEQMTMIKAAVVAGLYAAQAVTEHTL